MTTTTRTLIGSHVWAWRVGDGYAKRLDDQEAFLDWMVRQPGAVEPCWTCGALPVGVYDDGSWRYECHRTPGVEHGPTTSATPLWLPHREERA